MTSYNKPHLTYQQQIELLKNRGLIVKDEQFAIIKLQHISYYRLSAYFLPFQSTKDRLFSKYQLYLPTEEELRAEIERDVLELNLGEYKND